MHPTIQYRTSIDILFSFNVNKKKSQEQKQKDVSKRNKVSERFRLN